MAVPGAMKDLSTTASSNSPAGSENPISTDDFHRAIQAILRHTNAKGSDIASGSSIDLGAATGEFVDVTGTTTITALGTIVAGIVRTVRFTGALTLTHNATSLILPTGANITTAANDIFMFRSLGSGNWICVGYKLQSGASLVVADSSITEAKLADDAVTKDKLADDVRASAAEFNAGTAVDVFLNPKIARENAWVYLSDQASTSGTAITFSAIPSWVTEIQVIGDSVSTDGTTGLICVLGDSGGFETSGYSGQCTRIGGSGASVTGHSTSFALQNNVAAAEGYDFDFRLSKYSGNKWSINGLCSADSGTNAKSCVTTGLKTLSDTLTQVAIRTGDTFDAGAIIVRYR